jgi:hypothetical protein
LNNAKRLGGELGVGDGLVRARSPAGEVFSISAAGSPN